MKNFKLFVLLCLMSCSSIPEYKVVGENGPLTTFAYKDARLHVIKINQGIKICPTPKSTVIGGFYSATRSKSNYSLRFVKQEGCFWSPMAMKARKTYRVYVTMDEEKEVLFQITN